MVEIRTKGRWKENVEKERMKGSKEDQQKGRKGRWKEEKNEVKKETKEDTLF